MSGSTSVTYGPNGNGISYIVTPTGATFSVVVEDSLGTPIFSASAVPAANIFTSDTSNFSLTSAGSYYVVPGVTASFSIGVGLLSSTTIYVGGALTLNSLASVASSLTVNVEGGSLTTANSAVASALATTTINLSEGGTFAPGTGLLSLLSSTTINFGTGGGTFVANAGGTTLNLSGLTINGFTGSSDKIEFENLTAPLQSYVITSTGTTETITLYSDTAHTTSLGSVTVAGTPVTAGTYVAGQPGPLTVDETGSSGSFNITLDPGTGIVPCFLGGTLISTLEGEKRIDTLSVGDIILTDEGDAVPVRWIGRRTVSTMFADPLRALPVRIRAGALGDNLPANDLLISPDHAVLIGDTLINAGALVNGTSIVRETEMPRNFVYYHIEVDDHALILAEGVSAETFIDHVDRMAFDNWAEHAEIFGDEPEKPEMAYPRVKSARQLPMVIRAQLGIDAAATHGMAA